MRNLGKKLRSTRRDWENCGRVCSSTSIWHPPSFSLLVLSSPFYFLFPKQENSQDQTDGNGRMTHPVLLSRIGINAIILHGSLQIVPIFSIFDVSCVSKERMVSHLYVCTMTPIDTIFSFFIYSYVEKCSERKYIWETWLI